MTMKWTSIYKVEMVLVQDFDWSVRVYKAKWKSRRARVRVEGQWKQLGRVEDLLEDQELVWGLDKELLLVFVRKM